MADEVKVVEQVKTTTNDKVDKAKNWFINNVGFLLIVVILIVSICKTFIGVELTGKEIAEIIIDGAFGLIFGWLIKSILQEQGILKGLSSKAMMDTKRLHSDMAKKIKDYRPKLQAFCDKKNAELRIKKRTQILSEKNIQYADVFNDDNEILDGAIERRIKAEKQRLEKIAIASGKKRNGAKISLQLAKERKEILNCVKRAWSVKIVELNPSIMTSDGGKSEQPFYFGETIGQYNSKKSVSKLVFAFTSMLLFGLLKPVRSAFDLSSILWSLMQMGTYIAGGLMSFFMSYMFIIDTYRKGIIRKIDYLEEFETSCISGDEFIVPEEIIYKEVKNND